MKKNFLGMNTDMPPVGTFSFMDGFRFGFGMFVAWLLGLGILAAIVYGILKAFKLI